MNKFIRQNFAFATSLKMLLYRAVFSCKIESDVMHLKGARFVEKTFESLFPRSSNKKQLCWNKFGHDRGQF